MKHLKGFQELFETKDMSIQFVPGDNVIYKPGSDWDPYKLGIDVKQTYKVLNINRGKMIIKGANNTIEVPHTSMKMSNNKY